MNVFKPVRIILKIQAAMVEIVAGTSCTWERAVRICLHVETHSRLFWFLSAIKKVILYAESGNTLWVFDVETGNDLWAPDVESGNALWATNVETGNAFWANNVQPSDTLGATDVETGNAFWAPNVETGNALWALNMETGNVLWASNVETGNANERPMWKRVMPMSAQCGNG